MSTLDHEHPIDPVRVAHARSRLPSAEDAGRLTSLLSLMADPVRLRLIYALDVAEELCVSDLAIALDVSENSVSHACGCSAPPVWSPLANRAASSTTDSPPIFPNLSATRACADSIPSPTPTTDTCRAGPPYEIRHVLDSTARRATGWITPPVGASSPPWARNLLWLNRQPTHQYVATDHHPDRARLRSVSRSVTGDGTAAEMPRPCGPRACRELLSIPVGGGTYPPGGLDVRTSAVGGPDLHQTGGAFAVSAAAVVSANVRR